MINLGLLEKDEEEFVSLLAQAVRDGRLDIPFQEIEKHLCITSDRLDDILLMFGDSKLFQMGMDSRGAPRTLLPNMVQCLLTERMIRDRRSDHSANTVHWLRRVWGVGHLVGLHPAIGVIGGIVGIAGGLCGIIALVRGCDGVSP